jgi:tetratricopeptide (TPR) repeat protein
VKGFEMESFTMKNIFILLSIAGVLISAGCGTTSYSTDATELPADVPAAGESGYAAEGGIDGNDTYTGDGGKGTSITIFAPEARGLAEDQNYLPELVQGEFMSNFSGYSGISVFDRMNLDKIYEEQVGTGYYDDNDRARLDLGRLTSTDYIMNGSITKTATGYALQVQVTKSEGKMAAASYSGTCSFAELDNLTGIRRASRDLLEKLGVSLTEKAKTELGGAAAEQAVNAQIALSKGIDAMKKGTVVEALSYFVQSRSYDPQLAEAASRANIVSANISSGNIGEDARNDIVWRKAWLERLTECEQWVTNYVRNTPVPTYLYYTTDLTREDINYSRETLSISIAEVALRVDDRYDWPAPIIGVVNPVYAGLKATGRASAWEIGRWPNSSVARGLSALWNKIPEYETVIELVNDAGEVIGRRSVRLGAGWRTGFSNGEAEASRSAAATGVRFTGVDANKITDRLSIRIASLNGKGAEEAAKANNVSIVTRDEYWRTVAQRDLAFYKGDNDRAIEEYSEAIRLGPPVANAYYNRGLAHYNKYDYGHAEEDFAQAIRMGLNNADAKELRANAHLIHNCEFKDGVINKYTGTDKDIVIPEQINGEPVTGIGGYVFSNLGLTSVVIPNSVSAIGSEAFIRNQLTYVYVPDSLTSHFLGQGAFASDRKLLFVPMPLVGWIEPCKYKKGFSVSLPAKVDYQRNHFATALIITVITTDSLSSFYHKNGQKAGTYTYNGKKWRYEAKR